MQMSSTSGIISLSDLATVIGDSDLRIVDCRFNLLQPGEGRAQYESGHIPGAIYADLDHDLSAPVTPGSGRHPLPDADAFAATLGGWGIDSDTSVVAYDQQSGAIAARLWWMLRWLGHEQASVLDGGFAAWVEAELPLRGGTETASARRFDARRDDGMLIGTGELVSALTTDTLPPLVDAREAVRFAGDEEPIDAIAGHIPGAVNLPFGGNLDGAGRWLSPAAIAGRLAGAVPGAATRGWVSMCGSGVTACHLALAAAVAGFPMPRVYTGSWSEWIRDPARPVCLGRAPVRRPGQVADHR